VFPAQPGASHEHEYYGSDVVDAYTLDVTTMLAGSTTCSPGLDKYVLSIRTLWHLG
jgi:hypothetical protein